jgi:ribosomal protein S12 methylthiotransferase
VAVLRDAARALRPGARLVATGCMAETFRREIEAAVPEAEVLGGVRDLLALRGRLEGRAPVGAVPSPTAANPRLVTTAPHVAYLKISEGCNRQCAFCIIPRIRGRQRSRPVADVVAEALALASGGVREIVLVAEDLSHWGADLPGQPGLASLVGFLADAVPKGTWLRLMYVYPRDLEDGLLDLMANHPAVLPYLDIPVQHGDDDVLKAMRRGTTGRALMALVARIRARVPGVVLRTTYLVGFPGEDAAAFQTLRAFAAVARFEMAGVFAFSPEPGSRALTLPGPVSPATKRRRKTLLEDDLSGIAASARAGMVGSVHEAVVEERGRGFATGRLWFQAPEVDGNVRIAGAGLTVGQRVQVRITGFAGNDFLAALVPFTSGRLGKVIR